MVITPPIAVDASGSSVSASLSVSGDTVTMSVAPGSGTVFPVMAAESVAAPKASAARSQQLTYGFSDQRLGVFGPAFDPKLLVAPLRVRVARLIVPYDAALESTENQEKKEKEEKKIEFTQNERLAKWLQGVQEVNAGGEHLRPYVTLWSKGCLEGGACEAPSLKRYRKAVKALIKRYMKAEGGLPAVTMWGAWNEPDGGKTPLHSVKAAELWQTAHSVMVNQRCGCTMVAGEFSEFNQGYISRYKKFMVKHHLKPRAWGLHDYHDLVEVPEPSKELLEKYENHDAKEFAKITSTRLGNKPRIWLSEQGVELKSKFAVTRLKGSPELQHVAAEDFLRLAGTSSRVELVNYYMYGAPEPTSTNPHPEEELVFDSALKDEKGNPRPAYCVLVSNVCPPTAETGPSFTANGVNEFVVVKGHVNPNGSPTSYSFQYGPTTVYGSETAAIPLGSGFANTEVADEIRSKANCNIPSGHPPTHFRVVASSPAGTSYGADSTITYECSGIPT